MFGGTGMVGEGRVYFETGVCCCPDSLEERIVDGVGGDGECAVNNAAVDVDAEIDFEYVVVLENDFLSSGVGSPMCADVVQAKACGERQSSFECVPFLQTCMSSEGSHAFVNFVRELGHRYTRLCDALSVLTDLTVDLSGFAIVAEEVIVHFSHRSHVADFFGGSAPEVLILDGILDDLALRIDLVRKEVGKWDPRKSTLLHVGRLLALLLIALSFPLVHCSYQI